MLDERIGTVELLISSSKDAIWINAGGICIARICGIENLILNGIADEVPINSLLTVTRDNKIIVYDREGRRAGVIDFGGDSIKFSGNLHSSANSLFALLKNAIDPLVNKK